jgi:catechol 2,3-dioxygenase-like lactoylglutathione lyase family enzyme
VVIRTSQFERMLAWYRTVFLARTSYENPVLAFLTYDEEHHRIAFLNTANLSPPDRMFTGIDHVAFTYASLSDLLVTWERLSGEDIRPFWCINHGPTTSMYFKDPDGNELELQVDNFATLEEACGYFSTPAFASNPIGIEFDPAVLLAKLRAGVPEQELLRQGAAPIAPGTEYQYTKLGAPSATA